MRDIIIENTSAVKSVIRCGKGSFEKHAPKLKDRQLFIITDTNVNALYHGLINSAFGKRADFVIPAGEDSKNPQTLFDIIKSMLSADIKRNCTVVAFGGGVVGDIAGLAASLYMRGTRLVQIPTTLLAQVDSSVGGKTAVDMNGVKNLIGTFFQPQEVIADSRFLSTLNERELRCGLGEIIKYGALDESIYNKLSNAKALFDFDFLDSITYDCIAHKAAVVKKDERDELGVRKSLNLGHTTGHAIELYYGDKSHGECVLIGTYYDLYIAEKLGICKADYAEALRKLIIKVILQIPAYGDISTAAESAVHDKKNTDGNISLIVPEAVGKWTEIKLPLSEYSKLLTECAKNL
ncbi:MAG: 3-dehydroquinate synthase [Clostridia bacterium]|nr:3-dehydroquinate synthase [Clostridia bacterium]